MNPFTFNASSPNNNPDQSDQAAQSLRLAKPNARNQRRDAGQLEFRMTAFPGDCAVAGVRNRKHAL